MKRRRFLLLAGTTALTWNAVAAEIKIPRIGFVQPGSRQEGQSLLDAFADNLSALGWTEGKTLLFSTAGPTIVPRHCPPSSRS